MQLFNFNNIITESEMSDEERLLKSFLHFAKSEGFNRVDEILNQRNYEELARRFRMQTGQDVGGVMEEGRIDEVNLRKMAATLGLVTTLFTAGQVAAYDYNDFNKMGFSKPESEKLEQMADSDPQKAADIVNNQIHIIDYKTNKEIKEKGFTNWEGITSKMYNPVSHLDDCNLNHYNLQLSLYAYIIKKHNPKLKIGKLQIQHVSFEKEGENEHGYPITKYNDQGEPIIKEIKMYDLPYLKDEIASLVMWLKDNPQC